MTCKVAVKNQRGCECVYVARLGYKLESLGYFRRAIATDSLYLKAQDNLDNACSSVVERWHFRMLNDAVRNSAFSRAISRVLNSLTDTTGDLVVLDIGTGSGILRYEISTHCGLVPIVG